MKKDMPGERETFGYETNHKSKLVLKNWSFLKLAYQNLKTKTIHKFDKYNSVIYFLKMGFLIINLTKNKFAVMLKLI